MNSKFIAILIAIVVLLVLGTGAYYLYNISKLPKSDNQISLIATPTPQKTPTPIPTEKIDATTTTNDKLTQEDKSLDADMQNLDTSSKELDSKLNEIQTNLEY